MAGLLYRIGRFAFRRKWTVVVGWLLIIIAAVGADKAFAGTLSSTVTIPGIEAQQASNTMHAKFGASSGVSGELVFQAPDGQKVTATAYKAAIEQATTQASKVTGVVSTVSPFTAKTISANGTTAYTTIVTDATSAQAVTNSTTDALQAISAQAEKSGMTVALGGVAFSGATPSTGSSTEAVGLLAALIIMAFAFRSLRTALLPIATALVSVVVGTMVLLSFSGVVTMTSTAAALGSMLGIAVGIDYSLFIVSRHQSQVRDGMDLEESAGRAVATSGSAVVFAGATVVIALAALAVVNIPFLTIMGLGGALTIVVAVLVALTLIPALLGLLGTRVAHSRVFRDRAVRGADEARPTMGARWVALVTRFRAPALIAAAVALLVLATPATKMELGMTTSLTGSAKQAATMIQDDFGVGYNAPLIVLVTGDSATSVSTATNEAGTAVGKLPDVAAVSPPRSDPTGDAAIITVIPKSGPADQATTNLVSAIRDVRGAIESGTGATVQVTGQTAINVDLSAKLSHALPVYFVVVIVLAMVLLLLVFRSILVPVKAMLGFCLSALAALGATVAVFQWGWLSHVFGVTQPGQLLSFLPMLLLGVLFGLAMDYEVFLVSRMREEFTHGKEPQDALRTGFGHSARVVTAAALIMICVFSSFIASDNQTIKPMGFAFAIGILCDAFLVRMTLVPAIMSLLGRAAWWLPGWLDRIVPHVDIDGTNLPDLEPGEGAEGLLAPSTDLPVASG